MCQTVGSSLKSCTGKQERSLDLENEVQTSRWIELEHSRPLGIFLLRDGVQFQQLVHAEWLNLRVSIIHPTLSDMDYRIFNVRMCSIGLRIHKGDLGLRSRPKTIH